MDQILKRNNEDQICNAQGKNLLHLCIASKLRILNGRYVGDSLGYFTFLTANGCSSVDYYIVSESLLSSVLFFTTQDFNFLSDHYQIKLIIKCNITQDNNNSMTNWRENKGYRWTSESKLKIIEALSDENVKNKMITLEIKNFAEDQYGIDTATEELNLFFKDIANKSCKFIHVKKYSKEGKVRQKWSDNSVYEQKKSLNFLGKQLRKDSYNNQLKQKYFYQLKCFRKIVKQKKICL